jgi:glycosyltransferase involved in cell wall biosynthesis
MSFVSEAIALNRIRHTPGSEIVNEYSAHTREIFEAARSEQSAVPVIIAGRDEQADLPATLLSLSRSEYSVVPVVIDNASEDLTSEVADSMGAHVLRWEQPGKVGALQHGVHFVRDELQRTRALFVDADILPPKTWAETMDDALEGSDPEVGRAVFGSAIYAHGPSLAADGLRSARFWLKARNGAKDGNRPLITGQNMGIEFGSNQGAWNAYMDLDPKLFVGDDVAIHDVLKDADMDIAARVCLKGTVVALGDRFGSLRELIAEQKQRHQTKIGFYEAQYGSDLSVYDGLSEHQ